MVNVRCARAEQSLGSTGARGSSVAHDKLTLSSLLDTTLERHPQAGVLGARSVTVDAEVRYARRWLPDTTTLAGFHMSDQAFDDIGAYENEAALSFPMWLPGEGNGNLLSTRSNAWLTYWPRSHYLPRRGNYRGRISWPPWKNWRPGKAKRCCWRRNTWMPYASITRLPDFRAYRQISMNRSVLCKTLERITRHCARRWTATPEGASVRA